MSRNKLPALYVGHGSPMIALQADSENEFVAGFKRLSEAIVRPDAVLCISAHWQTRGTKITVMEQPPLVYDFFGFPDELYRVKYDPPGSPELARHISSIVKRTDISPEDNRGLDHGTWTVLKHFYPDADIPILQLSLNDDLSPNEHYQLARELKPLREEGVLIIGSGNLVHNLRMLDWQNIEKEHGYDWAVTANTKMKQWIAGGDHQSLINFADQGEEFQLAIPTSEHFLPLLYILALQEAGESVTFFNDSLVAGSLSMTGVKIGG